MAHFIFDIAERKVPIGMSRLDGGAVGNDFRSDARHKTP